jgi:DNA invertase Pin-like site-specific DNA recombinase
MRVGYVRCSTAEQNEARQMKMMEDQKVEKVFVDKASVRMLTGRISKP